MIMFSLQKENLNGKELKSCSSSHRAGEGGMLDSDSGSLAPVFRFFCHSITAGVKRFLTGGHPLRIIDLEADGAMSSIKENHKLKGGQVTKQT